MAEATVREARAKLRGSALCDVLIHWPLPVVLYVGDWQAAECLLALVRETLASQPLDIHHTTVLCMEGVLFIRRKDAAGVALLQKGIDELRRAEFLMRLPAYLKTLAQGLMLAGQPDQARAAIEDAIGLAERNEERWCMPELLRIQGELLQSETHCWQAFDRARRQGALSWQLRAAMSVARLRQQSGNAADACELLASVYDRFTEGHETQDLKTTGAWIGELRSRPDRRP